jgi:chromosomal replication initiator protein
LPLSAHLDAAAAWEGVRHALLDAVGQSTYEVWFGDVTPYSWDGSVLVLTARAGTDRFLADRFGRTLSRCAERILGTGANVAFAEDPAALAHGAITTAGEEHADRLLRDQPFVPRYTFGQFVIGDGNRLAHAAALAVAEAPGQTYNPLFLHAPPGLGKTHLLHAIGNYISAYDRSTTVRYTTVEAFTNNFVAALRGSALARFKALYRDVDVLLIDDVQFLASKLKTEEEFFHTFNALYDSGRQLVLTCDRLPSQLTGLEQRLRERFEAGLVAHLEAPDRATRIAILRKRAAIDGIEIADPGVFEAIADRVNDNIRSLEGALIRIVANHSLTRRPLDTALATSVLDDIHPLPADPAGKSRAPTVALIQTVVAEHFALPVAALGSKSRKGQVAWARQVAIYLSRELTTASLQQIGREFGGRSHATVLHACKRVGDRVLVDSGCAGDVRQLSTKLTHERNDRTC